MPVSGSKKVLGKIPECGRSALKITPNIKNHPHARTGSTKFRAFIHGIVKFLSEGTKTGKFVLVCVQNCGILEQKKG